MSADVTVTATRAPTAPIPGAARVGFWVALVTALTPALVAAVPALAFIPQPVLEGLLLGAVTGLGKIARDSGSQLWRWLGRWF